MLTLDVFPYHILYFSHAKIWCGTRDGNVGWLVDQSTTCSRLKYLNNCSMDCHDIWLIHAAKRINCNDFGDLYMC